MTRTVPISALAKLFLEFQEDVNGENTNGEKMVDFGADFHGLRRVFHGL